MSRISVMLEIIVFIFCIPFFLFTGYFIQFQLQNCSLYIVFIKMKLFLLIFISLECSGDWVKVDHFTPDLSYIKNYPQFSTMSSRTEEHSGTVAINSSVTSEAERTNENDNLLLNITSQVKDTLIKTSKLFGHQEDNSLRGKLLFLQTIKQKLLRGIWEKCKTLWSRKTNEPRTTFGFPSMEGAIITIAFLTFAVFLIKIVQQFVLGLQGLPPNTVGVQIPNSQRARHKRERTQFINETAARIFKYMDDFKIHYEL